MKVLTIIVGVLLIIAGFFFVLMPGVTMLSFGWILGIMLLIAGISIIADYITLRKVHLASGADLFLGILTGVIGIVLLLNMQLRFITDAIAVYMLGIWMVISGILRIISSVKARKVPGSGWGWQLALGIIMILLGVYAFFHPLVAAFALAWIIGFYVIFGGFNLITLGASMRKVTDESGEAHWTIAK